MKRPGLAFLVHDAVATGLVRSLARPGGNITGTDSMAPESLAAQIKNPQDRLQIVGKQLADAVGAKILAGGYSYGEYDISVIIDAVDDVTMAAVAVAIAAGVPSRQQRRRRC